MFKRISKVMVIVPGLFLALALVWACGDNGESEGGGDGEEEITIEQPFLASEEIEYQMPHLVEIDGEDIIFFKNLNGIYYKNVTGDEPEKTIPVKDARAAIYNFSIREYAVNENFFVWNPTGSSMTYRYQWLGGTQSASTTPLLPGFCIGQDEAGDNALFAALSGGVIYSIKLRLLGVDSDAVNRATTTLLDPESETSEHLQIQTFACEGNMAVVVAQDGRLYSLAIGVGGVPTVQVPLLGKEENETYNCLQVSGSYIVWVDSMNDIKYYNMNSGEKKMIDVDPNNSGASTVVDMRVFSSIVLWSDDSEGDYNVWMADLAAMTDNLSYKQITRDPADQRFPFMYRREIYWEDYRNGKAEIWSINPDVL